LPIRSITRCSLNVYGGRDEHGLTWENMYAISDLRSCEIPYREVAELIGRDPNGILQGVTVLKEEDSELLAELCGFGASVTAVTKQSGYEPAPPSPPYDGKLERQVVRAHERNRDISSKYF